MIKTKDIYKGNDCPILSSNKIVIMHERKKRKSYLNLETYEQKVHQQDKNYSVKLM